MGIPANPIQPGRAIAGKISYFGGPTDHMAGGTTASGKSTSVPGIATYNRATLGGYFLVTAPNGHKAVLQQTDLGPAPWTGRAIDFTYSSLGKLGYSTGNFPTDAVAHAVYLGKTIPKNYQALANGNGGGGRPAGRGPAAQGSGGLSVTPVSYQAVTTNGFDQAGYNKALAASIAGNYLSGQKDPFAAGQPKTGLSTANPLVASGTLSTVAPNPADYQTAQTQLQKIAGKTVTLNQHPAAFQAGVQTTGGKGGRYTNPLQGATWERTDMGVDASMPNGAPIRALGDSKVISIQPGWYKGQPLVKFQLLNGPQAGRYYYIAEAINPTVKPGQTVRTGQTVGTYNINGTGLELGWSAKGADTLAHATTGYTEGQATAAGKSFRNFLNGIGAHAG